MNLKSINKNNTFIGAFALMRSCIRKWTLCLAVIGCVMGMSMQSCSDDVINSEGPEINGDETKNAEIYIDLKLSLPSPTGTRATTEPDGGSSEGTMNGEENENKIENLRMLFFYWQDADQGAGTEKGYKYAFELSDTRNVIENDESSPTVNDLLSDLPLDFNNRRDNSSTIRLKVDKENLNKLAGKNKVRVYFIGNYFGNTFNIRNWLDLNNLNTPDPDRAGYNDFYGNDSWNWISPFENNGKLVPIVSRDFLDIDLSALTTEDMNILLSGEEGEVPDKTTYYDTLEKVQNILTRAFDNKTLELERICARVDFADGSPDSAHPYVYPLDDETDTDKKLFVKMQSLNVFNIQKRGYVFRHTAPGDDLEATYDVENESYAVEIFGFENGRNANNGAGTEDATGNDNNEDPEGEGSEENQEADNSYRWVLDCAADYKRAMANSTTWDTSLEDNFFSDKKTYNDHFINIAQTDGTFKKEGNAQAPFVLTELFAKEDDNYVNYNYPVKSGSKTRNYFPVRYISENTLPSQKAMIRGLSTGVAFEVLLCDNEGNPYKVTDVTDKTTLEEKGFVLADSDETSGDYKGLRKVSYKGEDGYAKVGSDGTIYLTYYYFLRHNWDSSNPKKGAPMKFGVVRNNIYRLCVTGFDGLPVPFDPQDPDENDYAIAVDLKVLAWVKRDITVVF